MNITAQDTYVTTSVTSGMTINMDAVASKMFLTSIATSLISQVRTIKYIIINDYVDIGSNIPHHMALFENYCAGVPSAHFLSAMSQSADILFRFVEDCVKNDTKRGLYLLVDISRTGTPYWELIVDALDEYTEFCQRLAKKRGQEYKPYYNQYNEEFRKLMHR